ncbi:unnamed protein product [[Candida] boidinii]|uniref:Unnamed protein product n=1 Tax=Candida boidinii TaxID=5477 RepID=A0A9W6WBQ7_CANBO|nr:unnamed protein product [[Candida] boidinii]GMG21782.1 unnamed protein product [[Candida] boidinii]
MEPHIYISLNTYNLRVRKVFSQAGGLLEHSLDRLQIGLETRAGESRHTESTNDGSGNCNPGDSTHSLRQKHAIISSDGKESTVCQDDRRWQFTVWVKTYPIHY